MADSLTFALIPIEGGYGYEILEGDQRVIYQPFDPDLPGSAVMDQARTNEAAEAVIARLVAAEE